MTRMEVPRLDLQEGRFARLKAIEWWDQSLLSQARILVIGAGALGNEVIKNLALLGLGHLVLVDMDRVEESNLCRSILFRESDEGRSKAECAASAAKNIYPEICVQPLAGNVLADVGLGYFRWAHAVVGALDNREARIFVNSACARVGRPWIDGGIEVLQGIVRGFAPPTTACYECTMSQVDWDLIHKRRSCSLLARQAAVQRAVPTTPTTASVVGAIQAQEVVKFLHGLEPLFGRGFIFEGARHDSYSVTYPIAPDCGWHEEPPLIESLESLNSKAPLRKIWEEGARRLGGLEAIDLAREMVDRLECPSCRLEEKLLVPVEKIASNRILCPHCGSERSPVIYHSLGAESDLLDLTAAEIGLPSWDIVWVRRGEQSLGFEFAGDCPFS